MMAMPPRREVPASHRDAARVDLDVLHRGYWVCLKDISVVLLFWQYAVCFGTELSMNFELMTRYTDCTGVGVDSRSVELQAVSAPARQLAVAQSCNTPSL